MNKPYVKEYNEDGICTNPIKGSYESPFPNRRQRNTKVDKNANRKLDYVQWIPKLLKTVQVPMFGQWTMIEGKKILKTWEKKIFAYKRIEHFEN